MIKKKTHFSPAHEALRKSAANRGKGDGPAARGLHDGCIGWRRLHPRARSSFAAATGRKLGSAPFRVLLQMTPYDYILYSVKFMIRHLGTAVTKIFKIIVRVIRRKHFPVVFVQLSIIIIVLILLSRVIRIS